MKDDMSLCSDTNIHEHSTSWGIIEQYMCPTQRIYHITIYSFLQIFLPKIVVMYILATIGGLFYLSKFPEKWFPGNMHSSCSTVLVLAI